MVQCGRNYRKAWSMFHIYTFSCMKYNVAHDHVSDLSLHHYFIAFLSFENVFITEEAAADTGRISVAGN